MKVYAAINRVQASLAKTGITKDRQNKQHGYAFRGIDDVYNAISGLLADNGLCILPRVLSRSVIERETKSGGALFYVTVQAEFDFVCAEDGSSHTVKTFGEAMDSGDKATNKAMSAAYKYAAFQAFAIPTEADNDADAHTHEVKANPRDGSELHNFSAERHIEIQDWVAHIVDQSDIGNSAKAWKTCELPVEEKTCVWGLLDSKLRSGIKKYLKENASE